MSPSSHALHVGPISTKWLRSIGVRTLDDVERVGSVAIYQILKDRGYPVSLNLVYALEGALMGVAWNKLPPHHRSEIKQLLGGKNKR